MSRPSAPPPPSEPTAPSAGGARSGGYYLDDGPGANPPAEIDAIPDAVPRLEALNRATSRPYVVLGVSYRPMTELAPYKARGLATWYGRRYNGKPTASGELYDMYAMSAAHAILPIPSYARVTNLKTGRSVVVRINDRGPFVDGRLIDVSYTAAHKLGILGGATMVEVESVLPGGSGAGVVTTQAPARPASRQSASVIAAPPPDMEKSQPHVASGTAGAEPPPEPEKQVANAPLASSPQVASLPLPAAAPAPAASSPPAQAPVTTEAGRVFLQLGAFGSRENADAFLARVKSQAEWLALQIFSRDGLHRVQAGPYASQTEARQAAERVVQALGIKSMVQTR